MSDYATNSASDCGLYIAVFQLSDTCTLTVGRLGRFTFQDGFYFYVGSARKNLAARLDRHSKKQKPLRWHIDYLSTKARMLGALTIDANRFTECSVAAELARIASLPVPGFGTTDCRCSGHLFYRPDLP